MLDIGARLNETLRSIKEACPDEEFRKYRFGFANAMAAVFLEVLEPIFKEHPSLEPPGLNRETWSGAPNDWSQRASDDEP